MIRLRLPAIACVLASCWPAPATAQPQPPVNFERDVQPIFRDRCYECHGPDQQMNGFRLDRRDDALRGGSQSVIGPGNASGSRMYIRLIGTSVGPPMPPTGPLSDREVGIIRSWIDEGAVWPDDLAGAVPVPPVDPDATRLAGFLRDGKRKEFDDLLRSNPRAARGRTTGGSTVLMMAALYADAAVMTRLIDAGADANARNAVGATALMWAVPDVNKVRVLVSAGADVNARSDDRRTALTIASGMVGSTAAVTVLLEYGATPFPAVASDPLALREAVRVDNVDVFRLLLDYGADGSSAATAPLRTNCLGCAALLGVAGGRVPLTPPPDRGLRPPTPAPTVKRAAAEASATSAAIRAAVDRALPLIQRVGQPFIQKTGCVSCHHNSVVATAVTTARQNGYRVDEAAATQERATVAAYLESWRERTLQNVPIAGAQDTINYLLVGLAASNHPADQATDAQTRWLLRRQEPSGRWPLATLRPPIESNDIEVTALSMRALQLYAPVAVRPEYDKAIERAGDWLATAAGTTTEERAFRLLGLSWAKANGGLIRKASEELLAGQNADGGWSQEPTMASDAYATGEALAALQQSGTIQAGNPNVRRAVEFLLRTQLDDGSWFVKSRSIPIQAYFESGFPHGADQWISAAATAWAVTALAGM